MNTLAKISQNIIAYSFVLEDSEHFFYVEKKSCIFSGGGGGPLSGRGR